MKGLDSRGTGGDALLTWESLFKSQCIVIELILHSKGCSRHVHVLINLVP